MSVPINFESHFPSTPDQSLVNSGINYDTVNTKSTWNFTKGSSINGVPISQQTSVFLNTTGATSYTIDLSVGNVYDITLSNSPVTLTVTNANKLVGNYALVIVRQDSSGSRIPIWSGVTWLNQAVPEPDLTAGTGTTIVRLWCDNGATVYGQSVQQLFPGFDPVNVPGVTDVCEAWTQPWHVGETITTAYSRLGTNLVGSGSVLMGEGWRYQASGASTLLPLGPIGDRRYFFDMTTTSSYLTWTKNFGGTNTPFTVFLACEPTPSTTAMLMTTDPPGGAFAFSFYNNSTILQANLVAQNESFVTFTQPGSPSAPYAYLPGSPTVISVTYDSSGNLITRINGITCTSDAVMPITFSGTLAGLQFSKTNGLGGVSDGKYKMSSFVAAVGTKLDFSTPSSVGSLIERWMGYQMGLVL